MRLAWTARLAARTLFRSEIHPEIDQMQTLGSGVVIGDCLRDGSEINRDQPRSRTAAGAAGEQRECAGAFKRGATHPLRATA